MAHPARHPPPLTIVAVMRLRVLAPTLQGGRAGAGGGAGSQVKGWGGRAAGAEGVAYVVVWRLHMSLLVSVAIP